MDWVLRNIPLLAFIFVMISIVRAVLRARELQDKGRREGDESVQDRRVREIQEEIRRKIAERRGERSTEFPERPVEPEQHRALVFDRQTEPPPLLPPVLPQSNRAELERQFQIEDELRAAEDLRQQTRRRAVSVTAARDAAAQTQSALRTSARDRLLIDLGDSQSLRRAFVLREVLGPPVGLGGGRT